MSIIATFENRNGDTITTGDPTTAQRYRERPEDFTEVTTKPVAYTKRLKAELEDEIAQRNAGRGDDDQLSADGTKDELAARLEADDARTA